MAKQVKLWTCITFIGEKALPLSWPARKLWLKCYLGRYLGDELGNLFQTQFFFQTTMFMPLSYSALRALKDPSYSKLNPKLRSQEKSFCLAPPAIALPL